MNRRALLKALCASAPAAVVAALVGPKALAEGPFFHTGGVVPPGGVFIAPDHGHRVMLLPKDDGTHVHGGGFVVIGPYYHRGYGPVVDAEEVP